MRAFLPNCWVNVGRNALLSGWNGIRPQPFAFSLTVLKHFLLGLLLLPLLGHAQLRDDFTDGNFTANPAWTGDVTSFQVTANQLQSNGPAVTGSQIQLVTPCTASTGTTWEFWANLRLATSSGNLADVWLMATRTDLKNIENAGYFVRLGGTADEVSLFRKDSARSATVLIDGQDMTLGSTNNLVRVRVTRSTTNQWTLERDLTGGSNFTPEANMPVDAAHQRSVATGVLLVYSMANARNFYFDDFAVTDVTPPLLASAGATGPREVDVVFNENMAPASAGLAANYRLAGGAVPVSATLSTINPAVVRLVFGADLVGQNVLEVRNVADAFGNVAAGPLTAGLTALPGVPRVGELIITELFIDETPTVGLPLSEYIEIYNRSATRVLSLRGVRLGKTGTQSQAVFADTAKLLPGQYAIVCGSTRVPQFAAFNAKVYGPTSFPSLTNTDGQLLLRGRDGQTLFEVNYSDTWYGDPAKKDGGWSLEMRDVNNYCAGADNWHASTDVSGGTPGRANSVATPNPDATAPTLRQAVALDARTVRLYFSEKLDSTSAANPARYVLAAPGPAVTSAAPIGPDFRAVDLTLAAALLPSRPATLTVQMATDCAGNASGPLLSAAFALPEAAVAGDVVINELLFNPRVSAVRFVELLNRSNKFIDLQGFQFGNERADGTVDAAVLSAQPLVLEPGQLRAFSTSSATLMREYPTGHDPANLTETTDFPTLSDTGGTVVLFDNIGRTLDRLTYDKSQHLSLLSTLDGVSLERIRASGPSLGSNFHSAAGAVGYATPGRANSQAQDVAGGGQDWTVAPEVFTPDDDGQQDLMLLSYQLDQPGYAGSVTVYDALGRLTRRLLRNETLATSGVVQWDGTDERGRKAAVGYYILHVEVFRPSGGERQELKKTVVLGARF